MNTIRQVDVGGIGFPYVAVLDGDGRKALSAKLGSDLEIAAAVASCGDADFCAPPQRQRS